MPNYGASTQLVCLTKSGGTYKLFDAETPAPPQASVAFSRAKGLPPVMFTASWENAPTAVLEFQGSNVNSDSQFQQINTTTNTQLSYYADGGGFLFYRVKLISQSAGGALTVTVS